MHSYENVTLTRDVDATRIPSGEKGHLQKGTQVTITQVLGGTYTVQFIGGLARIEGKDADALGKTPEAAPEASSTKPPPAGPVSKEALGEQVCAQLRTCYDPEIPVDVVELGLVFLAVKILLSARPSRARHQEGSTADPDVMAADAVLDDARRVARARGSNGAVIRHGRGRAQRDFRRGRYQGHGGHGTAAIIRRCMRGRDAAVSNKSVPPPANSTGAVVHGRCYYPEPLPLTVSKDDEQ